MILSITLNPLLERRLIYNKINYGEVNRTETEVYKAGGKGINVNRQLNFLGIQSAGLTFLGGNNGKMLRKILTEEEINFTAVNTKNETRSGCLAIDNSTKTISTFFGPNPVLLSEEINEFEQRLEKAILNSSIVVISGSSPSPLADEIFIKTIELCGINDKLCVLDTYGEHLKDCIDKAPAILHNNLEELEKSLNISLKTEKEITDFLDYLYSKGIKMAFLTNGEETGYASKFDFKYKFTVPDVNEIDATGSGDAFVSGICYGLEKSMVFEDFLKFAAAAGAANCTKWDACASTKDEIESFVQEVKIDTVGKKMKIIDDSPNY